MAMALTPRRANPTVLNANPGGTVVFECSVCMEPLNQPASIGVPDSSIVVLEAPTGRPATRLSAGRNSPPKPNPAKDPSTLVATACGHVYHQLCLEQWLGTLGQRPCPSCRTVVQKSQTLVLYPSATIQEDVAGPAPTAATRELPGNNENECPNEDCQELRAIHGLLTSDNQALRALCNSLEDEKDISGSVITSLQEDNAKKDVEINTLKRRIEELEDASISSRVAQRRRQQ